jgi:hypothetical protein
MRKDRGLDGVGEGEREGTLFPQNSTLFPQNSTLFPQNSTDQRFKTAFCRFFKQN